MTYESLLVIHHPIPPIFSLQILSVATFNSPTRSARNESLLFGDGVLPSTPKAPADEASILYSAYAKASADKASINVSTLQQLKASFFFVCGLWEYREAFVAHGYFDAEGFQVMVFGAVVGED